MKKTTLLVSLLFSFYMSEAQNLTATNATTPVAGDVLNSDLDATVTIHNNSSVALDVMVERTVNTLATGQASYFCWDQCYGETTSTSDSPMNIAANSPIYVFHGHLRPYGYAGQSSVTYNFYDQNAPSNSVSVTFVYDITTGIQNPGVSIVNHLSEASPNPANNLASISYNTAGKTDARIVVYNLLGKAVKEIKLNEKQGALVLVTSDLGQGIYYYSLVAADKMLATRKLVVAHR